MSENNPDFNKELWLNTPSMTRHCLGIAATGGGKSNFLNLQLKQQMMRGGGCIHIDGKNSKEAIMEFINLARLHDRWHDVRIINIDDATLSNTYNPLMRGDADELTARIMALIPQEGENFFRSQAVQGIRAISGVIRDMNIPVTVEDLLVIMRNESAMRWLVQNGPKESREYRQYKQFFESLQEEDRRTGTRIMSERKQQFAFGDLVGKLSSYDSGNAARVMNVYNPEVDLLQSIKQNELVYVALPMLSKEQIARDFAKLFISDLQTAVGQIQNITPKPSPTFLVLMDEFSSYAMPSLAPLFEQARSANVSLFPFIQTISSLKDRKNGLSEEFASKILGNTYNKIAFGLKDRESQEMMSKLAGEYKAEKKSFSSSDSISFQKGNDDTSMVKAGGRGRSHSESVTYDYQALIRPEEFGRMNVGEAFYLSEDSILKVKVPLVEVPIIEGTEDEKLDFPRFKIPQCQGLDMINVYNKVSGGGS